VNHLALIATYLWYVSGTRPLSPSRVKGFTLLVDSVMIYVPRQQIAESASKKPPPVTARAFCFARKGLETQQDYSVPTDSVGVPESTAETSSITVLSVSYSVKDL
jgi:hypothetical protein